MRGDTVIKLLGGRTVLLLNLAGLLLACFFVTATTWTGVKANGVLMRADTDLWLSMFFPVAAMFIIRNVAFSSIWVAIYVLLSVAPARWVWATLAGDPTWYHDRQIAGVFFVLSLACLGVYLVAKMISFSCDLLKHWVIKPTAASADDDRMTLRRFGLSTAQLGALVALPSLYPALLALHVSASAFWYLAIVFVVSVALIPLGLSVALIAWFFAPRMNA